MFAQGKGVLYIQFCPISGRRSFKGLGVLVYSVMSGPWALGSLWQGACASRVLVASNSCASRTPMKVKKSDPETP